MTYPTSPALNSSEAEYPGLWNGLVWAYLPGYNKNTTIVGGDTLSRAADTTIDSYAEGLGETIPLQKYRQGVTTPLESTSAASIHAYYRVLWTDDGTPSGILSTAPSTAWKNIGAIVSAGGFVRSIWRRAGVEAFAQAPGATGHSPTFAPVVNAMAWRNASVVGARDVTFGESTVSATALAGVLTNTEPVIVGSYYDKSSARSSNIAFFCGCIWSRDLTLAERDLLQSDPYAVFRKAAADTTAPTLTSPTASATGATTASGSVTTNEANGTLYYLVSANATELAATVKAGSSQAVTASGSQFVTVIGLTASTPYYLHFVHTDAAANDSAVETSAQFTTDAPSGDADPPTLTGAVTFTSITQTSYTANWPAGSDNVAVTGYEYQIGSTAGAWTDAGNNLSAAITGRTAGTTETVYVRAYDAAGLRSTPAISGSVTLESALAAGINVTEPLKNNTGTVLASQSGVRVAVLQAADLVSVYEVTGLTTNASGIVVADIDRFRGACRAAGDGC